MQDGGCALGGCTIEWETRPEACIVMARHFFRLLLVGDAHKSSADVVCRNVVVK